MPEKTCRNWPTFDSKSTSNSIRNFVDWEWNLPDKIFTINRRRNFIVENPSWIIQFSTQNRLRILFECRPNFIPIENRCRYWVRISLMKNGKFVDKISTSLLKTRHQWIHFLQLKIDVEFWSKSGWFSYHYGIDVKIWLIFHRSEIVGFLNVDLSCWRALLYSRILSIKGFMLNS